MKKIFLLFFISILYSNGLFAQELWKSIDKSDVAYLKKTDVIHPENSKYFSLDTDKLVKELKNVYSRGEISVLKSDVLIKVPNLDGNLESYRIIEASVMTEELQKKFPNIRSYAGQGVDNPANIIRFSVSPQAGFSGMIRTADKGTYFIEPETSDNTIYAVYDRSQRINSGFVCTTEDTQKQLEDSIDFDSSRDANDGKLHTFRLALSCTGEYGAWAGGTEAGVMAKFNATMTRVNGVFEADFSTTMVMIDNEADIIYFDSATDPYSPASGMSNWNAQLQNTLTTVIGEANYDIGHLFGRSGGGGNAGCIGCVCVDGQKGSGITSPGYGVPQGDNFDIDYVAHEMGHQFGATHTFTFSSEGGSVSQVEPGSGSTIMGYAGITGSTDVQAHSDPYFIFISIIQVTDNIMTKTCDVETDLDQNTPTVEAGPNYTIPKTTPFMLTGVGTADGTPTYCWEQNNVGGPSTTFPNSNGTSGPSFRSFDPVLLPYRFFPKYETLAQGLLGTTWEKLNNVSRNYRFALTVRDNIAGGGQNKIDQMFLTVDDDAGPFAVTSQTASESWNSGTFKTITWNVANTDAANVNAATVDILFVYNGGDDIIEAANDIPNNGSYSIMVPHGFDATDARVMVRGHNNVFFAINSADLTIVNMAAGVDENYVDTKVRLFPNPTDGLLEIDNKEFVNLVIYNVLGQQLASKSFEIGNNQIDISQYERGVYFVQAILNNNASKTYRIVKK